MLGIDVSVIFFAIAWVGNVLKVAKELTLNAWAIDTLDALGGNLDDLEGWALKWLCIGQTVLLGNSTKANIPRK